ncbi:MAG: hypothetical protein IPJ19_13030 [Planctomycetes bacterium]|nr:hypothetical protein [Planctomycetota bacterium]
MQSRALAAVAVALLLAACRGTGERAASPGAARALGTQESPTALGPQFASQVDARFTPGLEALERAVTAGEDPLARSLIQHLDSQGPDPRVWQFLRSFERILDGRAAVGCLELKLVCAPEPLETLFPGAEAGAQAWRLLFRAQNTSADEIELSPGPATLFSTRTDLGRRGAQTSTQETRNFDRLKHLRLEPNGSAEVELARFFLAPTSEQLAVRLSFELELRSGVIERGGRELPAMRLSVASSRATRHADDLPEGTLTPSELLAQASGPIDTPGLLALAVRTDPGENGAGLPALEDALAELPRPRLELWIPALRWLAGPEVPTDASGLRAWLREGRDSRAAKTPRPKLVLPGESRAAPGGGD